MSSISQYLDPTLWRDMLHASVGGLGRTAFWIAVPQIVFVDILLSGDNAVVIAMACRGLPPRQRRWGLVIGAGLAVLLLLVFAAVVVQLMLLPYLKLIGGLALLYIAARLLVPEDSNDNEVEATVNLWRAVRTVLAADLIMSLDNIIAVAAVARGNLALLAIGLAISIPVIVAGAAVVMALLDRLPILIWAGSALLGWVAGETIATDTAVSGLFGESSMPHVEFAASGIGALLVVAVGALWRHLHQTKASAAATRKKSGGA